MPWVNKVSSGALNLTPKNAQKVSLKTGISAEWLLSSDLSIPPLETDNKTPYSRDSYDRHLETTLTASHECANLGIAQMLSSVLKSLHQSIQTGKIKTARNDLWEFTQMMKGKYGSGGNHDSCLNFATEIQGDVEKILGWNRAV